MLEITTDLIKNKKIKIIVAIFMLFSIFRLSAQSNTVAVGVEATGSGGTVSFTGGDVFYTYKSSGTGSVTEGVQQSYFVSPTGVISGDATVCSGVATPLSIVLTGVAPWSGTLSDGTVFSGSDNPLAVSVSPTVSTTYTIATLIDGQATATPSDLSGSAVVTVNLTPATPIISAGSTTTFCDGENVVLTSSSAAGNQWYKGGVLIADAINETYIVTETGSYTVITKVLDCTSEVSLETSVTVNALPMAGITNNTATTILTASTTAISVTATGGENYSWTGGTSPNTATNSFTAADTYTVTVTNTNGCVDTQSITILFATVPDAPTNLIATGINTGGMIQFTVPISNGGADITNYEYSLDGGATWVTPTPAITESPLIIPSGLTNCTEYQVQLRAVNAAGPSAASVAVTLTPAPSTNPGEFWTTQTSAADNNWTSVTYGNGLFVAVARNSVMTSPDGITWTAQTSAADNYWSSITYGNGLFVAVSYTGNGNRVMTSPDGITWTSRSSAADNDWQSVTYGNGKFVAVASTGTANRVMTSPDGIIWTSRSSAADNSWTSVTYGNSLFVAMASTGTARLMTSPDGVTWTSRVSGTPGYEWSGRDVTYGNGLFVAVTDKNVRTSTNGIYWESQTVENNYNIYYWRGVTYGNGYFVAVSNYGSGVMTSTDGINWVLRASAVDNNWNSITYGNSKFVAILSYIFQRWII
ncbi:fibronectin type III domain-containing protein [Maribacter arcticus]|nr:fibronectin type III domain-containing protein [Maribacter arcticus]MDA9089697.1 fibronectin type III domain-containing protein [Maribacter arcticus]